MITHGYTKDDQKVPTISSFSLHMSAFAGDYT